MNRIQQLLDDFPPDEVDTWAYPSPDTRRHPYAKAVNYFAEGMSIDELAERNMREARKVNLSETRRTINQNGLHLGVVMRRGDDDPKQLTFEAPVPLDDAISGDQPPITGFYPRVVFPASGEFPYAIMFIYDEGIFGTEFETHTLEVPAHSTASDVFIPLEIPCEDDIRKALRDFFPDEFQLPQGDYKLTLEVEKMPHMVIRIDGYRPICSLMQTDGEVVHELPIMSPMFDICYIKSNKRPNPLKRLIAKSQKYVEIPFILPSDAPGRPIFLSKASLEYDNKEDSADLVYQALRRPESIAEVRKNLFTGLVEVQIARVAKLHSVNIEYTPREIPNDAHDLMGITAYLTLERGSGHSKEAYSGGSFRDLLSAPSVNVGRTVLANPKTGPVSPKMTVAWDQHLYTFRLCLTNEIN